MSETPDYREWQGEEVRAASGDKIGSLEDVYFESETGHAMFLLVKSGLLGRRLTFVPVRGTRPGRTYLQVQPSDEEIKQAPTIDSGADLTADDEERIYRYYSLDYQRPTSGRRLMRR
ncbi:MAG: PRC-barrel domain-containing protein [Candidatus Dormiibacterota bacterium]